MLKFKPQFRRLQFVHGEIKKGGYPNCRTLAAQWETSAKTIQRDIDYLKYEQKAPIEYDATKHGYYYTDETYDLPAIRISEGDLFALAIAEKALAAYRNTPIYDRLLTIFSKIKESLPEKISVHPSWVGAKFSVMPQPSARINPAVWETVARGLRSGRVLKIEHHSPWSKESTIREVEPRHMMSYQGEWYLIGLDRSSGESRIFALSRIQAADVLEEVSACPADFDADAYMRSHFGIWAGEKMHNVRIWFSPDVAPLIKERDWHPSQKIRENKDGSLILSLRVAHLFELKQWVLSWGAEAQIIAPSNLRKQIRSEHKTAAAGY